MKNNQVRNLGSLDLFSFTDNENSNKLEEERRKREEEKNKIQDEEVKEIVKATIEEEKKLDEELKIEKKANNTKKSKSNPNRKNFILPTEIIEKMNIIAYMDRDIKDNTDLVIKALTSYLDSESCKKMIKEYYKIKETK